MTTPKTIAHRMALDAWSAAAVALTLCFVLEALERGFVSRHFNVLWLVLASVLASLAVMATHPGAHAQDGARPPVPRADALLALASVLAAAAVWTLLPRELALHWRAAASGITLAAALTVRAAFAKNA
jgi:hypothetical protein